MNKRNRKIKQGKGDYVSPEEIRKAKAKAKAKATAKAKAKQVELVAVAAKSKTLNDKYNGVSGKDLLARAKRQGIRANVRWGRMTIIKKLEAANDV